MAVQKSKKSSSRKGMRRSHHALAKPALSRDPLTGELHLRHRVGPEGLYRGRMVLASQSEDT